MRRRVNVTLALLLAAAASARPAGAGSDTDQLTVTATVPSSCGVTGGVLDFGRYAAGQPTDLDATGAINYVNCSGELTFALDGGAGGSVAARQMRSGSSRLNYQIYRNATRTAVWGTGGDSHGVILLTPQSGSVQVYGRVFRDQAVPDGAYGDVVNITLSF